MRRPHEMQISDFSQGLRIFGRPDLDTNKQIKTSQTRRSGVRVASAVTKYLPEDGSLYATAVSFVKPLFNSSRNKRWRKVYLAASPDCVIKMNANVSVNLNGGDEIPHKSVPTR
jgi:hypothetical protein